MASPVIVGTCGAMYSFFNYRFIMYNTFNKTNKVSISMLKQLLEVYASKCPVGIFSLW